MVPFLVAVRGVRLRNALLLAWAWTVVASAMTTGWFPVAVAGYYKQSLLVGVALFLGVTTFTAALHYAAFAAAYRGLVGLGVGHVLLAGAAWAAADLARVELTGDPWAIFGYSQAGVLPIVQIADLTGVYGIAFLLVTVNAALAELWLARGDPLRQGAARRGLLLAAAVVGAALTYGFVRAAAVESGEKETRIAVVQANLDAGSQWRPELYGRNLDTYLRLSYDVLATQPPALVVWPESAMTFFLDTEPLFLAAIGHVVATQGAELLAGGPRHEGSESDPRYYNTAFLVARDGAIAARYDKRHLLPFAEYFPWRSIALLRREFGRVREFTPGRPSEPLPTVAGRAGIVICNEALFPDIATERVRDGAEFLVNLSNDSWVGDHQFATMAAEMASLRAVEQRRYLVRASTSGPSAIVDPRGRRRAGTTPATRDVITGAVQARAGLTPYARLGDAFGIACALAVGVALAGRRLTMPGGRR
jgi:apolipoprotein N-acyltransferase